MQPNTESETDHAVAVEPPIVPTAAWRVHTVRVVDHGVLDVQFVDGVRGEVDLRARLQRPDIVGSAWEPLRDRDFFARAAVSLGVVSWPGEIDLAPDAMYDEIRLHGRWILS
jgi:hypothetical protein